DGVQVQQRLCGMFVIAIPGVEQRYIGSIGSNLRRTRAVVPQHNGIGVRFKGTNSILKRLALIDRRDRLSVLYLNRLSPQPFDRRDKRGKGAAGRLKKEQRDDISV